MLIHSSIDKSSSSCQCIINALLCAHVRPLCFSKIPQIYTADIEMCFADFPLNVAYTKC